MTEEPLAALAPFGSAATPAARLCASIAIVVLGITASAIAVADPLDIEVRATGNCPSAEAVTVTGRCAGSQGTEPAGLPGIQIATIWEDAEHRIVITCTEDGSSAVFNPACEVSEVMYGDTSSCVPGTCAP